MAVEITEEQWTRMQQIVTRSESKLRALEEEVATKGDLLDRLMANGLKDMLKVHGGQLYGGGVMRIDQTGIQILTPGQQTPGIFWLNEFEPSTTITAQKEVIEGGAGRGAFRTIGAGAAPEAAVRIYSDASNPRVEIQATLATDGDGPMLQLYKDASTKFFVFEYAPVRFGTTVSALTIAAGAITASRSYHLVDTEAGAASDDLDTINGGGTGQILIIRPNDSARTVVAKNGTGNLLLAGVDCSMDNAQDTLTLLHTGASWLELARSNNGA